ncbi:hypothetical protein QZH41_015785 [Actinostola sp. cb2023]|nr:hypothetical protein QZH41_015785 [Actinostola sp. cb2023]
MSKNKHDLWQLCEICGRLVYLRHFDDHKSLCEGQNAEGLPKCCYIENGVLHGRADSSRNLVADSKFPLPTRQDVILLNIHTMKACKVAIGGKVLLHSHSRSAVCIAWPSNSISPECVALSATCLLNCKVSPGDPIQVSKLSGVSLHASKVELQLCNNVAFEVNKGFISYCLHELDGHFVFSDHVLDITYYGQPLHLRVSKISGTKHLSTSLQDMARTMQLDQHKHLVDQGEGNASNVDVHQRFESLSLSDNTGKQLTTENLCDVFENGQGKDVLSTGAKQNSSETCHGRKDEQSYTDFQANAVFYYISSDETSLSILPYGASTSSEELKRHEITFSSIGGLEAQIQTVREMVEMPLKHPEMYSVYGLPPTRGVLLYGPSGTGKTMIARAVANETGVHFICINGPDVLSRYYGESEARLRDIFTEAEDQAPSIVFIDEIDALCPRRDKVHNEFEKRVVATLLTLMDGTNKSVSRGHVMVLAATNRPDALDPALRRPGRFDREIEIGIPNVTGRRDIITTVLRNVPHSLRDEEISSFAETSHGYVGADLSAVCKEAGLLAFKRCLGNASDIRQNPTSDKQVKSKLQLTIDDMKLAFRQVRPSAMREVAVDIPKVRWSDVGGNKTIKQKLKEAVEWPLKHPEAFQRMGITPPRGILMYGPPGCSKTLIARALATESGLNFIAIKGPELFSKWVGESERAVREVFRKARAAAPSIIFFDEIDAVAVQRGNDSHGSPVSDRVLTQLLTELDGVETLKDVILIAATNRPDMIDKALMRPGRLDRIIYVPLPDWDTRNDILKIHLSRTPCGNDVSIEDLGEKTEGYSGAEIAAVCKEAALAALEEDLQANEVRWSHFEKALTAVKPRTSMESLKFYDKFQQQIGIHCI